MCTMCDNSDFLYCTIPSNTEIETYPYIAYENLTLKHHRLHYAHHSIGYYDLSEIRTVERFKKYMLKYYLIICDAEVGDFMSIKRTNLIRNVTRFYLRNKTENGILRVKMNICENRNLHLAIGILTNFCEIVDIYIDVNRQI